MARISAEDLDIAAAATPAIIPSIFRNLGTALLSHDGALQSAVKTYATKLVQTHAARMRSTFSAKELPTLVAFQLLDPLRYAEHDEYRRAIDTILPRSLSPSFPEPLRRAALNELNRLAPVSFDTSEALAVSAGLLPRPSGSRFDANPRRESSPAVPSGSRLRSTRSIRVS